MLKEKSAGAIVFRRDNSQIYYLLLHYPVSSRKIKKDNNGKFEYWGLPKGHIEEGEGLMETVRREVKEETGLKDIKIIEGFKEEESYIFTRDNQKIFKTVIFLLAETKKKKVKISWEHLDYQWLNYQEAFNKLTYSSDKLILKKANEFLLKNKI